MTAVAARWRHQSSWLTTTRQRALEHGLIVAGIAAALWVWVSMVIRGRADDALAYWSVNPADPYAIPHFELASFPYAPLAAQLFAPLGLLPWPVFVGLWTAMLLACVLWLVSPRWWLPAVLLAVPDISVGNIHLPIAVGVVLGLRHSAAWWVPQLFLKVTPAVGIAWHLFRREWRSLGIVTGLSTALVGVSWALAPDLWPAWFDYLRETSGVERGLIPLPLWLRGLLALGLVGFASLTERRWLMAIALVLALPYVWWPAYVVLYAIPRLKMAR